LTTIDEARRAAILRPLDETSWTARAKCAERLSALYCQGMLDAAEETFRLLSYDGEILVRRVLAECLKRASCLPRDIALALATDKSDVSIPFIEDSPSLADHDLLTILRDHPGPHRLAIAGRESVSAEISDALCRCDDRAATIAVLANQQAAFALATLHFLLDRPPERPILEAIARRRLLPIAIGERLRGALEGRPSEASCATMRERVAI
jgi:uncharacterized protein (DUF2336 family)